MVFAASGLNSLHRIYIPTELSAAHANDFKRAMAVAAVLLPLGPTIQKGPSVFSQRTLNHPSATPNANS
jgi:hypothetical protein